MTTTPASDALYALFVNRRFGKTEAARLIDAALAEDRAAHADEVRAAALTDHERQFLTFALDLAFDRMVSDDGFTDEDEAALESLRRMAAAARPDNTGA